MKPFFRKLAHALAQYDSFGVQPNLNIRKARKYQSTCGGILSLIMTGLLLYILISGLIKVFSRSNYKVEVQFLQDMDPEFKIMNNTNFMFAVSLNNPFKTLYPTLNKTAFQVNITQFSQILNSDGSRVKSTLYSYSLEQCTEDHFPQINFLNDELNQLQKLIPTYLCLPKNFSLQLQGTYNSDVFLYPKFIVSLCTSENCYSTQEIQDALNTTLSITLSTIIQTSVYYSDKSYGQLSQQLNSDFYLQTNLLTESYGDLFFESNLVMNKENLLSLYESNNQYNYWVFPITNYREIKISQTNPSILFSYAFRLGQQYKQITKTVNTIDEFLSYFGGILKLISTIFGLIAIKYNELGLMVSLANQLYQINVPKVEQGKQIFSYDNLISYIQQQMNKLDEIIFKLKNSSIKIIKMSKVLKAFSLSNIMKSQGQMSFKETSKEQQSPPLTLGNAQDQLIINQQEIQSHFLENLFQQMIQSRHQLKLGFNFIIYQLLCCSCFKKIQLTRKMLQQCESIIQQDLDIVNIMQKLQQIDKLKLALFQKDQLKVFNYLPKPLINIESNYQIKPSTMLKQHNLIDQINQKKKGKNLLSKQAKFNKSQKLFKIYQSYERLKQQPNEINNNITNLLGPVLSQLFEKYYEIIQLAEENKDKINHNLISNHSPDKKDQNDIMEQDQVINQERISIQSINNNYVKFNQH